MQKVTVVGAGAVGLPIALELLKRSLQVTVVAEKLPGDGITADLAAGIGCVFKPSSEQVGDWVLESYQEWMRLARDSTVAAVRRTRLVTTQHDVPTWADRVVDFKPVSRCGVSYLTYAFNPLALGTHRLGSFLAAGGTVENRPLSAAEVGGLRRGEPLCRSDYTVVTLGLGARALRPDFGLFPIRGVLVHFEGIGDNTSYMDEEACSYVISRPGGLVVGGTFDQHVETCSEEEKRAIGMRIVHAANARFGLRLDSCQWVRVTVGYRPGVAGNPVVEVGDKVAHVNGLGGQGWVTGPALSRFVADAVEGRLAR